MSPRLENGEQAHGNAGARVAPFSTAMLFSIALTGTTRPDRSREPRAESGGRVPAGARQSLFLGPPVHEAREAPTPMIERGRAVAAAPYAPPAVERAPRGRGPPRGGWGAARPGRPSEMRPAAARGGRPPGIEAAKW